MDPILNYLTESIKQSNSYCNINATLNAILVVFARKMLTRIKKLLNAHCASNGYT